MIEKHGSFYQPIIRLNTAERERDRVRVRERKVKTQRERYTF